MLRRGLFFLMLNARFLASVALTSALSAPSAFAIPSQSPVPQSSNDDRVTVVVTAKDVRIPSGAIDIQTERILPGLIETRETLFGRVSKSRSLCIEFMATKREFENTAQTNPVVIGKFLVDEIEKVKPRVRVLMSQEDGIVEHDAAYQKFLGAAATQLGDQFEKSFARGKELCAPAP